MTPAEQWEEELAWRTRRLEELRTALRNENISYGELLELQDLAPFIQPGDVELAEAAGIAEEDFQ